jgi:outer membrane protein TolC
VTPADPARARAAVAEAQAEHAGLLAERERARASLARLVGEEALERPLGEIPEPPGSPSGPDRERGDVAGARSLADAGREAERATRAARWPSAFLQGKYELHAPRPTGQYGDSGSVVLGVKVPLFTSGALAASVAEAGAEARGAEAAAREIAAAAEEEVRAARASHGAARERRRALEEGVVAAGVAREIQRARYEEGVGRLADLLDARLTELRARLGASAARADEALAGWSLRLAAGQSVDPDAAEVKK